MSRLLSVATQNNALGQEMAVRAPVAGSSVTVQVPGPPLGLADARTRPEALRLALEPPTATHRCSSGHEMPATIIRPSIPLTVHAPAPPVGCVDVMTLPFWSTATQSDGSAQETPLTAVDGSTGMTVHADVPPAGFVDA